MATFPMLWNNVVAAHGDRLALVCDEVRLTYAQVDHRSRVLAKGLIAIGCAKGSRVALLFPNSADFLVAFVATVRIGATAIPLSTLSTPSELAGLVRRSDTQVLLSAGEYRDRRLPKLLCEAFDELDLSASQPLMLRSAPWLRHVFFRATGGEHADFDLSGLEQAGSSVDDAILDAAERTVRPSDWLLIIHTSGSTSEPKGVIHAHGPLLRHLRNINELRDFGPDEILFSTSPWFWVAGLAYALIANLIAGARMVISNESEPAKVLDFVERERPTLTQGHFSTVRRLAADPTFPARDLTSIRRGNLYPISPPGIRPADQELRHNIFGMSEAGGALTMDPDESDQPEHRRGSCGRLLPGFEWRIVDPETGIDVETGQVGELWIRSPLMMVGYYGKTRDEVFEPDGWWRSADLGRVDEDGLFYPVGRLNDMIKTSGANVAPAEVAGALSRLSGHECIVVGVPDAERGQIVAAVVVSEEAIDTESLRRQAKDVLSAYKVPRLIRRLRNDDIPKLSSGKIDMRSLQESLAREYAGGAESRQT